MATLTVPYRLLTLLLYGEQDFITRVGTTISAPMALVSRAVNCKRPTLLRPHLVSLEELGLISSLRLHKHMFTCKLLCPIGMEWNFGEEYVIKRNKSTNEAVQAQHTASDGETTLQEESSGA